MTHRLTNAASGKITSSLAAGALRAGSAATERAKGHEGGPPGGLALGAPPQTAGIDSFVLCGDVFAGLDKSPGHPLFTAIHDALQSVLARWPA